MIENIAKLQTNNHMLSVLSVLRVNHNNLHMCHVHEFKAFKGCSERIEM